MGEQQKNAQEPDLNQLRKVRREKLADLQANGKIRSSSQSMSSHITARRSKNILRNWRENRYPSQDV